MADEQPESFRISLATIVTLLTLVLGGAAAFYAQLKEVHQRVDEVRSEIRAVESELEEDNSEIYEELRRDIRAAYQELRKDIRAVEERN